MNQGLYNDNIKNNPYLNMISIDENSLFIKDNSGNIVKKVDFISKDDLSKLPIECFQIRDPHYFLDILSINNECEKKRIEIDDKYDSSLTIDQKINRYFLDTRHILDKKEITKDDLKNINEFLNFHNKLIKYNGYLTAFAKKMFHEMGSILSWTIDDESLYNTNYAVKVIRDHIKNINEGRIYDYASISNAGGFSKTRSNPNVPKIIDDDPLYDKAGFFSFLSLLYIVITLLVSLVILAIKK